jgi:transposase
MPPKRSHELTQDARGRILALYDEGYSCAKISKKLGIPRATVWYTVKRAQKYHTTLSRPRPGRPHKFPPQICRLVIQTLCRYRFEPYKSIANRIGSVTARQVRYIANKKKYRRYVTCRKPFLDRQKSIKRLNWARMNRNRNWDSVTWTDEVQLGTDDQPFRPRVTRQPGEAYLPNCIVPTFQSGRKSLMVWSCISHGYKGPLVLLELEPEVITSNGRKKGGGLSSEGYASQVLEGPLKDFIAYMEEVKGHEMLVVEDGAPPHWGKAAKLAREKLGIHQLSHPPSSPDLNPIEAIWRLLKSRVYSIPGSRQSLTHLWATAQAVWDSITIEEINKHTGQMKARVVAVAAAKGLQTKF